MFESKSIAHHGSKSDAVQTVYKQWSALTLDNEASVPAKDRKPRDVGRTKRPRAVQPALIRKDMSVPLKNPLCCFGVIVRCQSQRDSRSAKSLSLQRNHSHYRSYTQVVWTRSSTRSGQSRLTECPDQRAEESLNGDLLLHATACRPIAGLCV